MAAFIRQKRQSRFYWAELGFMALGLLGLQPALFTSFLMGPQAKQNTPIDSAYSNPQVQAVEQWAVSHLANALANSVAGGPISTPTGWAPQPISNANSLPSTSYNAGALTQYQNAYATQPNYHATNFQPAYPYAQPSVPQSNFYPQTQSAYYNQQSPAQPQYHTAANYNATNYGQTNMGYGQSMNDGHSSMLPYGGNNLGGYAGPQSPSTYATQPNQAYNASYQQPYYGNGAAATQPAPHAYSNGNYPNNATPGYGQPNNNYQNPASNNNNIWGNAPAASQQQSYSNAYTAQNPYSNYVPYSGNNGAGTWQRYQPSPLFR